MFLPSVEQVYNIKKQLLCFPLEIQPKIEV